jgi:hypothetical protein
VEAAMKPLSWPAAWLATVMLTTLTSSLVSAQERCRLNWEIRPADTTYTRQYAIDVGDVPGHQIRIFEVHRRFPNDKPNCEGLKRTESWASVSSDYIDRNGSVSGYLTIVLENGDRIFGRMSGTSQTSTGPDGAEKSVATTVTTYTGGTGRYRSVRGIQRESIVFDPGKNFNQVEAEAEYWFQK